MVIFLFLTSVSQPGQEKKKGVRGTKGNKKWAQVITLGMREKKKKSPNLENRFQQVAKLEEEYQMFLLPHVTCSQIWLSTLVEDRQPTESTNFLKKYRPTDKFIQPEWAPARL
jgi:hypothetical protein